MEKPRSINCGKDEIVELSVLGEEDNLQHTVYAFEQWVPVHITAVWATCFVLFAAFIPSDSSAIATEQEQDSSLHAYMAGAFALELVANLIAMSMPTEDLFKQKMTIFPTLIKFYSLVTYFCLATGFAPVVAARGGRLQYPTRTLTWACATSYTVHIAANGSNCSGFERAVAIALNVAVFLFGALYYTSKTDTMAYTWLSLSFLSFVLEAVAVWYMYASVIASSRRHSVKAASSLRILCCMHLFMWSLFGLLELWLMTGRVSIRLEAYLWCALDIAAKKLFTGTLYERTFVAQLDAKLSSLQALTTKLLQENLTAMTEVASKKDRFIAILSHELRTPVNGIVGLSDAALHNLSTAASSDAEPAQNGMQDQLASFTAIRDCGKRLLSMVNSILDGFLGSELKLKYSRIHWSTLANEVAVLVRPLLHSGTTLKLEVPADLPSFMGDRACLMQVLFNLLGNAAKFCSQGGIVLEVRLEEGDADGEQSDFAVLCCRDTGIGIPGDQLESIFEWFQQADMSHSRGHQGSGLGLAVAKQHVEAHSGSISVESVVGQGTCFTVRIPLLNPGSRRSRDHGSQISGSSRASTSIDEPRPVRAEPVFDQSTMGSVYVLPDGSVVQTSQSNNDDTPLDRQWLPIDSISKPRPLPGDSFIEGAYDMKPNLPSGSPVKRFLSISDERRGDSVNEWRITKKKRCSIPSRPSRMTFDSIPSKMSIDSEARRSTIQMDSWTFEGGRVSTEVQEKPLSQKWPILEVLSVDDDPVNQMVIKSILEPEGIQVVEAMTGFGALEVLAIRDAKSMAFPAVILMDLMMPAMSGVECVKKIREMYPEVMMPIVMVSALSDRKSVCQALDQGCNDYICKPFNRRELISRIKAQVRHLHHRPELISCIESAIG
ncbi:hypothetical protein CYMTET_46681 [Cymbomonas tetramitiformis]|uniref:histidine kinase n=1 Tax=Cymbomonas tetramitiformis TaxID=36881 RepID=A0AAE0BX91_9CHLO|nr:hypothetical protein CYMTET_46681 [Cymbomonas tetramitiformis]